MKVILIGFMGSGKSTVARALGEALQLSWLEMDEMACRRTETATMKELFEKGGELLLRETEISIAKELSHADNVVIATGGGAVMNQVVLEYLRRGGAEVIFLNASFSLLKERIGEDRSRPLFRDAEEARALYDLRQPLYLAYADKVVDVEGKTVEEIVEVVRG